MFGDVSMFGKSWEDMYAFVQEGIQSKSLNASRYVIFVDIS